MIFCLKENVSLLCFSITISKYNNKTNNIKMKIDFFSVYCKQAPLTKFINNK